MAGCLGKDRHTATQYPRIRDDVVKVAHLPQAPTTQIAKGFDISEATLYEWIRKADVENGARPGITSSQAGENRKSRRRNYALEQVVEILRRAMAHFTKGLAPQ